MTNYNGPDGFTAHCSNCGQLKIRHSFVGSRCPGTFEQRPVVRQEAGQRDVPSDEVKHYRFVPGLHDTAERQKQIDSAEWVSRVSDALAAAKELVETIEDRSHGYCFDCSAMSAMEHYPGCSYEELRERILAAP